MREVWNVWTLCLLKMIKLKDLSASLLMLIVSLFQSVLKIMMVIKGITFDNRVLTFVSYSVAFVSFAETNLVASEPGAVEVIVVLIGNVTFDVNVIVEFVSENSSATGIAIS